VLTEKDGVQTYIRVVDTFVARLASVNQRGRFPVWLAIICKSGEAKGEYSLTLRMNAPSGNVTALGDEIPVTLTGDEHGLSANIQMVIDVEAEGLYVIDVLIDGEVLTRVPFRVRLERRELPQSESSTRSEPDHPEQPASSGQ
jgi:hypothetical protein